jgi:hypothetical protein
MSSQFKVRVPANENSEVIALTFINNQTLLYLINTFIN